jgi:hypothetical protein
MAEKNLLYEAIKAFTRVPLAAIFVNLGNDGETEGARQKIARYYWCGVLGELYGGAIESRFARDLPEVVSMVRGELAEPISVQESSFQANRLLTLRTRNSSAYKGLYALLMRDGGRDFHTGEPIEAQTFFDDKVDIHHIFPEKWCKTADIDPGIYNSVINKTPISARTNRQIGGRAPSKYLSAVEKAAGVSRERMDEILHSHCIAPELLPAARQPNERWSMDFVTDCVSRGKVIRMLTIVDDCTRECPAIEVDTSQGGLRVRRGLDRIASERGLPEAIVLDNGPEFRGRALARVERRTQSAAGVYSAGQTGTERFCRELQRAIAR